MSAKQMLKAPTHAWPTLLLALFAVVLHTATVWALLAGQLSPLTASILVFIATCAAFTPMHDASHKSASKNRILNEVVGRLCAFVLLAPLVAFRYVHLEHHKHTNHPDLDPDCYSFLGPKLLLPLRWLTQDWHYYWLVAKRWRSRPLAERVEILITLIVIGSVLAFLAAQGQGSLLLLAWLVPSRLAIGALSWAFDYLPHSPHQVTSSEDRFEATRVIECPGLTYLLFFQNYHLIHHLYPGVPFYRYQKIYESNKAALVAKGMRVTRWL